MLAVVVVVAVGVGRVSVATADGAWACPGRALPTAVSGLPEDRSGLERACVEQSQQRMYTATASVMGLLLITGLLVRRPD